MMGREIKIKISPDGNVEIDSSIFKDCKEVADHLSKVLGKVEHFIEKDELDSEEEIQIDTKE
jgi:hypothetical protein